MEYITVEKGIVTGHFHSSETPEAEVVKVTDWDGVVGSDVQLYDWDNNGILRSQKDLIADGLYEDNRGTWYVCADQWMFEITEVGAKLPEGIEVTQEAPLSKFDEWDGVKWVANTKIKEIEEKQQAIDLAQQKVINRLAETMDKLLGFISSVHTLTESQQVFVDDFRNDYAAWQALEE